MEYSLQVKDARQRDVYRGIARISEKSMHIMEVSSGDPFFITGTRKTVIIAWPAYSEDQDKNIIRIDGFTRKNSGEQLDGYVKLQKANPTDAELIVLSPIDMKMNVDADFTNFVKNRLMERVFVEGDIILVMMLGNAIPFKVIRARPRSECFRITSVTNIHVLESELTEIKPIEKASHKFKTLLRLEWLRAVSSRIGAESVIFSIPTENVEEETESKIVEKAKAIVDDKVVSVSISVNFYSDKKDLIGTLPWAIVDFSGYIKPTYPDNPLPSETRYLSVRQSRSSPSKMMVRRCFKTGLDNCPKDVNISPNMVFVAMPFRASYQDLYKYAIRPALEEMQLKIWKADEKISNIDMMCKICQGIQESSYVLANITDWNANVLFEMGLAYGLGKNVILIKDRKEQVPVDIKGLEYIDYENIDELKRNIMTFFKSLEDQAEIK